MARRYSNWTDLSDLAAESTFDSRDVEAWISELEDEQAAYEEDRDAANTNEDGTPVLTSDDHDRALERAALIVALIAIRDEAGCADWHRSETFVNDSYFEDYARELADDLGYLGRDRDNPLLACVDWEQWTDLVRQDYSSVEVEGATFWYRT